jgi:hypothetical protein
MIEPQQLIRRHDRIRAVWQRTPSANTAERCRLRVASIAREAREDFDRKITATLPVPGSSARAESLENVQDEPRAGERTKDSS